MPSDSPPVLKTRTPFPDAGHPTAPSWFSRLWLGVLFLVLPLAQWPGNEDPTLTPGFLCISLAALASFILLVLRQPDLGFHGSRIRGGIRFFFVFLLVYAVAIPDALHLPEAVQAWSRMALPCFVLYLSWKALSEGETTRAMAGRMAVVSMLVYGSWALVVLLLRIRLPFSPLGLHDTTIQFAEWGILLLPFISISLKQEASRLWKMAATAALAVLASAVLLSAARAALIGGVVWMLVMGLLYLWQRKRWEFRLPWRTLAVVAGAIVLFVGIAAFAGGRQGPINTISNKWKSLVNGPAGGASPTGLSERQALWRGSERMIAEHWTSGIGPGNWKYHAPHFGAFSFRNKYADRFFEHPHNDMLWVFSEAGLPAMIAWLIFLVWCVAMLLSTVRRAEASRSFAAACVLAALAAFLWLGAVSYPLSRVVQPALLFTGIAWAADKAAEDTDTKRSRFMVRLMQVMLTGLAVLLAGMGVMRLQSDVYLAAGKADMQRADWAAGTGHLKEVNDWYIPSDREGIAVDYYRGLCLRYDGKTSGLNPGRAFSKATEVSPWHPPVLLEGGMSAMSENNYLVAASLFRRILEVYPGHFDARLQLAEVYILTGKPDDARDVLAGGDAYSWHWLYKDYHRSAQGILNILPPEGSQLPAVLQQKP